MCWSRAGGTRRAGKGEVWSAMVFCLLCTKGERSRWMNEIDTSEWPPSPGDWAHSAYGHMCSLFLWVPFLLPLSLPQHFPLSSPCNQPQLTHLINNPHYSVSGAPEGNRSLPSKVLPPLGLPCFPSTHPSAPSSPKARTMSVCSHNSILGFSRPPADPVGSSCKNTACAVHLSDYSCLLTGGAASSKGEGRMGELPFSCMPSSLGNKEPHLFTPPAKSPRSWGFQKRALCKSIFLSSKPLESMDGHEQHLPSWISSTTSFCLDAGLHQIPSWLMWSSHHRRNRSEI